MLAQSWVCILHPAESWLWKAISTHFCLALLLGAKLSHTQPSLGLTMSQCPQVPKPLTSALE